MKIVAIVVMWGALVASLATAATATAAEPAFYECVKVARGVHGEFTSKTCTTPATGVTGKYDLKEGIGTKHTIALRGEGVEFSGVEGSAYECDRAQGGAQITSPTTLGDVELKLSGCERACTSPGQRAGTILLGPLSGTLGYVDSEKHEVGVDLAGEGGHPVAEFKCGPGSAEKPTVQLTGSMIAVITGDVDTFTKRIELVVAKVGPPGQQEVEQLEGGIPDVLGLRRIASGEEEGVEVEQMVFNGATGLLEIKA